MCPARGRERAGKSPPRLCYEARLQRGGLTEWYGERAIHGLFGGIIWPDGTACSRSATARRFTSCLSLTARPSPPPSYETRPSATRRRSHEARSPICIPSSSSPCQRKPALAPPAQPSSAPGRRSRSRHGARPARAERSRSLFQRSTQPGREANAADPRQPSRGQSNRRYARPRDRRSTPYEGSPFLLTVR